MKVYLLTADDGTRLFYAEPPEIRETPEALDRPGIRGWLERKARNLKTAWNRADRGVAGRVRHAWNWLIRRTPPDETMLVQLRLVTLVEIHHPASLDEDEVRALWGEYLASRRRRHLPRFAANALIAPLTVVLAPLPGPNLVGYWFAYRAFRHFGALLGVHRAAGARIATSFHPTRSLDSPLGHGGELLPVLPHQALSRARVLDFFQRSRVRIRMFAGR